MKKLIEFTCCNECYFTKECNGDLCGLNRKNVDTFKHYANKVQIEALIEEAEKRHREKCGLVVCSKAKECDKNCCEHSKPHRYNVTTRQGWCENTTAECGVCIAFRGEPAKEDEGQEYDCPFDYVIVKDIHAGVLVNTDIDPVIFKQYYSEFSFRRYHKGIEILDTSALNAYIDELERLNFIEKVVHDPVVRINDCFKRNDGYKFMIVSAGSGRAILTGIDNNAVYNRNDIFCVGDKLSDFVGDTVKDFKPIKIKTTEDEEG